MVTTCDQAHLNEAETCADAMLNDELQLFKDVPGLHIVSGSSSSGAGPLKSRRDVPGLQKQVSLGSQTGAA